MPSHHVEPSQATCHGNFSRDHAPILTIAPGDTVVFRTLDAGWHIEPLRGPDDEHVRLPYEPLDEKRGDGHCLCGPVAIRGAEPGMTLSVRIDEIAVGNWGWTWCGGKNAITQRLGFDPEAGFALFWELDAEKLVGRSHLGHEVDLKPFMGVMGMPPAEPGLHKTFPPRPTGGNLDCKELMPGTTLYLPIEVAGGLFSVGDGHALQGDGEACYTAIECPMDRVVLTFDLHSEMSIPTPRARLEAAWMTLGLHETLDESNFRALDAMVDLMVEQGVAPDRISALALASLVVDLRVTQIANGVLGVHAILPDGAIRHAV